MIALWGKIKLWALIVGGAAFLISLLLLRIFVMGSESAKAANTIALGQAKEKFDERIQAATKAGDSVRRDAADGVHDIRTPDAYKRERKTK